MYKLVVVAGKLRGEEFELGDGENILGRDSECQVHFPIPGVSKRHLSITVTDDVAYLEDLESANGTFLNGKAIKRATIQDKDKIALPDAILQVVYVKEKKVIVEKIVASEHEEEDYREVPAMPTSLVGKVLHVFKYKVMNVFHGINEEYEWRILFGIVLAIFAITLTTLTIFPVLQDSKMLLLHETAKRGGHYAEEIGRMNKQALESNNLDQVNTNFLEQEDGVESYALFDMQGRIVRPLAKMNEYISDPFVIEVREWAEKTQTDDGRKVYKKRLKDGLIGIGKKIMAYDARTSTFSPVGVIAIKFAPRSLAIEAAKSSKAYAEALMTSFIVAVLFFGIVYYLTLRHFEEMKHQIEEALRGKRRSLESDYLMSELNPLRDTINNLLQKVRESQGDVSDGEFDEGESDEKYTSTLREFIRGASGAAIALDSEKKIVAMNPESEDLTGIRENASIGEDLLNVCRERGFAATIIELCDNSANNGGTSQDGSYELQGHEYQIFSVSLMGNDGFAKAFYITFVREE